LSSRPAGSATDLRFLNSRAFSFTTRYVLSATRKSRATFKLSPIPAISRDVALPGKTPEIPLHVDMAISSARIGNARTILPIIFPSPSEKEDGIIPWPRSVSMATLTMNRNLACSGEVALKAGKENSDSARLEALASDAKSKGFGPMACQAALAVKAQPPQKTN